MNWKFLAMEKLQRFPAMRQAISSLSDEIRQLELSMEGIKSPSLLAVAAGSRGSGKEDKLLNDLVYRQELQHALEWACQWVRTVEGALSCLTEEEVMVLQKSYMSQEQDLHPWISMQMERTTFYRKRDKALENFTLSLYGTIQS